VQRYKKRVPTVKSSAKKVCVRVQKVRKTYNGVSTLPVTCQIVKLSKCH
jgi:hypothetical protein